MSPLTFPPASRPLVTVILVTFNAWKWTERALAALLEHTAPSFEVVIVDNASTDGTGPGLAQIENVTILRNPCNRGFGPAANQGVTLARAPHVVFLNTDALVRRGWLEPLLAIVDSEPDVGAVAPRLLHMNGRLQEAGSILWRDGLILNYGDGDDPSRPEYHFRRDVDYASAACILVRRSAFIAAGGFNAIYAPAYFEDVDLCQMLWAQGMRTVFEPRSSVTHLRWGSTGSQDRVRDLAMANLPVFRQRWQRTLNHRPPRLERHDPPVTIAGRDIRCPDRILVVSDLVPEPAGSASLRCAGLLSALAGLYVGSRVTLLALSGDQAGRRARSWGAAGVEVAWPSRPDAWLRDRRLHYDAVIIGAAASAVMAISASLRTHQPQAQWAIDLASTVGNATTGDQGGSDLLRMARLLFFTSDQQRALAAAAAPEVAAHRIGDEWDVRTPEGRDQRQSLATALASLGMVPEGPPARNSWHDSAPRRTHHGVRSADV